MCPTWEKVMIEWSKAVHRKNMCVCLANGKVSYLCRVAFATYILKGRFSDINADLTKSGKFHRYRHIGKMFRPRWAWTVFSYSYIGFTRACQAEFEQGTLFLCASTGNWGSRKIGRVGIKNNGNIRWT